MMSATARAIARWPGRGSNSSIARASGPSSSKTPSTPATNGIAPGGGTASRARPPGHRVHLVDAHLVAPAGKGRLEENPDEREGEIGGEHAGAEGQDVRVVVLAREAGGVAAPDRCRAHAGNLVRSHRHADPG